MRIHRSTGTNPPKERIFSFGVCGLGLSIYPINRLFRPILALRASCIIPGGIFLLRRIFANARALALLYALWKRLRFRTVLREWTFHTLCASSAGEAVLVSI